MVGGNRGGPEQISGRLRFDFLDGQSMRISHEAIYQALYVQRRGAFKLELFACLRTGRALRVPRARAQRGKSFVSSEVMISERPTEADAEALEYWKKKTSSEFGAPWSPFPRYTTLLHFAGRTHISGLGSCRAKIFHYVDDAQPLKLGFLFSHLKKPLSLLRHLQSCGLSLRRSIAQEGFGPVEFDDLFLNLPHLPHRSLCGIV